MIVRVIREYRDKGEGNKLRLLNSVIDYKDEERAKEIIEKGFAKEVEIITVNKKRVKAR
ncbi:hypothetical protein [Peptoniphilus catoniae]|uniref:hypothetical protein n=1 Tax=Peptoniphilus catoniae TaxID=1660341 RepID=UPI0015D5FCFD|nr:hypothetical protein [Peptoniphilus catoniae]